jgi:uncharacterized protein
MFDYVSTLPASSPLVHAALAYAEEEADNDPTGHDFAHIARVYTTARIIATAEGGAAARMTIVELIAALHDVKDFKFTGDEFSGAREARRWLLAQGADPFIAEIVSTNIGGLSFKGADTPTHPLTVEGQIVQDADRLDAIGAIGIARVFAYGGAKGRPIHDPGIPVARHATTQEYLTHQGTSITHFYEKLLLVKDRMNTATGKRMAAERHRFLETFLQQFYIETGDEPYDQP